MKTLFGFKEKSIAKLLVSLTIFAGTAAMGEAGGSHGGGGGAYMLPNGKVVTLPEFGVLIQDNTPSVVTGKTYPRLPKYYSISLAVYEEYERISARVQKIIPSFKIPGEFSPDKKKLVSKLDVDPNVYEQIKKEYRSVLEAFGYELIDDKFFLPAYSENGVTYILPDFEKLDNVQKAKYLIHEAQMRTSDLERIPTLERALKIDTLIQQLAFPKKDERIKILDVLKRLAKLKIIGAEQIFHHVLLMMVQEMGGQIPLFQLLEDAFNVHYDYPSMKFKSKLVFDPSFVQEFQIEYKLKANYAEMLEGVSIDIGKLRFPEHYSIYNKTDKTIYKRECPKGAEAFEKVIVDPRNESRERNLPAQKVVVARCTHGGIEAYHIDFKNAGPFIAEMVLSDIEVPVTRPKNCARTMDFRKAMLDFETFQEVANADLKSKEIPINGMDESDVSQCLFFDLVYNNERIKQLPAGSQEAAIRKIISSNLLNAIQEISRGE